MKTRAVQKLIVLHSNGLRKSFGEQGFFVGTRHAITLRQRAESLGGQT